jgi:hypothetical protein
MQTRYVGWSNNNQKMNEVGTSWRKQTQLGQNTSGKHLRVEETLAIMLEMLKISVKINYK